MKFTFNLLKTNTVNTKEAALELAKLEKRKTELNEFLEKENINTFEDACKIVRENPTDKKFKEGTKDEIAYKKLKVIIKAANGNWVPDWNNSNEYKYYPYFTVSAGFGFSNARSVFCSSACVSRLCFKTAELAECIGRRFEYLYKDFLI